MWITQLTSDFVKISYRMLYEIIYLGTSLEQRAFDIESKLIPFFIKFSKVINFLWTENQIFHITYQHKFFEMAKFRPDMVTLECYPVINCSPTLGIYENCNGVYTMNIYKSLLDEYKSYLYSS